MLRSQFNLFRNIGLCLYGDSPGALRFAMDKIAQPDPRPKRRVDPQLILRFREAAGEREKTATPSFFGDTFVGQCQKGVLLSIVKMDKTTERGCLNTAYDKLDASDVRIIDSESPDYLVDKGGERLFGVEVTEIYANEGAARIVKIEGYSTQILSKKPYRHKDDLKYLPVQKVRYSGNGGKEIEVDALVQRLPAFPERVALLIEKLQPRRGRLKLTRSRLLKSIYSSTIRQVCIRSPIFLIPFSRLFHRLGRTEIINSKFRESSSL